MQILLMKFKDIKDDVAKQKGKNRHDYNYRRQRFHYVPAIGMKYQR
jgi:hypothetical protein